ncbi:MAG: polyphosphate kinase 1 [Blastocatellia bacterium AA13]|nr:MAG: polyphosphate kinase 1 [Blastocatellia bacterium AA13]
MTESANKPRQLNQEAEVKNITLPKTLFLQTQLLFNRELSWLEFNRRVLEEGLDRRQPLLERLNFLSIFSSNLDEFFMIRVSGLKQQMEAGVSELSPDGMLPAAQLKAINEKLRPMLEEQVRCLNDEVLPGMASNGIIITPYRGLSDRERRELNTYFIESVFPVLTPLAVDRGHPFPYISNLSLNLGVMVDMGPGGESGGRFARVKVPPIVPRLVPIGKSDTNFTLLEELIAAHIETLFPGMNAGQCHAFRVTRDADIEMKEEEAGDLLRMMEEQLRRRRFGAYVRLEVAASMPGEMVRYIAGSLGLSVDDVYTIPGPLNIPDFASVYKMNRPDLKHKVFMPVHPAALSTDEPIFEVLKKQDVLFHHPYDTFSSVVDFVSAAAADPSVVAIKMTLYRAGKDSPIVHSLVEAAEQGKQVAALVELKARFDEENNISWARQLEQVGVHVVYGIVGLKTHCKIALVVRRENGLLRRYVHIGTGNYNPTTARIYEDLGLLTTNEAIAADVSDVFNYLTGYSRQTEFRRLLVAPVNLRDRLLAMIDREVEHQKAQRPARIVAKLNSLTDTKIIRALYYASQSGVEIDLIVRGICTLIPGVSGLSSNIRVISIVGRFLEHSRIFYFANGGDEEVYIGSADWMLRNLERRVELIAPIDDPKLRARVKTEMLDSYLKDNVKARRLSSDGSYTRVVSGDHDAEFDAQSSFCDSHSCG